MSEMFIRKWSELSGERFDAEYYKTTNMAITTYPLKSFVSIRSGKRIPKGETYSNTITPYKYLRVEDLDSESLDIDIDNLKSIDEHIFKLLSRYEIHNDEIALSIAGTIGKIFLFKNSTNNQVILTENCVKLQAMNRVLPKFLSIILKTSFLQNQMKRQYIQTTIPKLAIERIKELQIPQIPNKQIQQQIIDIMDNAYKVKKDKEQQAQELLDSIDEYLLGELGITMPQKANNTLDSRIFTQKISALSGSRFDPSYHQKYYQDLEKALQKGKYPLERLKDITNFIASGATPKSKGEDYEENGKYYFLRLVNFTQNLEVDLENVIFVKEHIYNIDLSRVRVKRGDILFGIAGSIGKIAQYNYDLPAVINQAIAILRFKKNVFNDFILCILSSNITKNQTSRLQRPVAQLNINIQELESLKIPLPPLLIQEQIADEITHRRDKAKKLQQEAKEILESAKKEVEKMILGG
ncbi:restriction endonuclease subunit S [Helicobacter sp. MIT 05-5293]|uniref:restriction endonuclease subunit S n=1 Tax=Helicobacter sp. MIT 05-5293 TaxID=1548149 RepID=UPI00051DEE4D|nr:restriction endonuclease subunit S [Helicobacter sp. MIT 05-5293]TLD80949.1 restriction endonuclease subunit S [Helicobacter sp. MIT 05-5293]